MHGEKSNTQPAVLLGIALIFLVGCGASKDNERAIRELVVKTARLEKFTGLGFN